MAAAAPLKSSLRALGSGAFDQLAALGVTPNQVTCIGLVLVICNCALYLLHRDTLFLGIGLSLSYAFDALDGALARRQGTTSRFGGYLDAVVDRYQEIAAYLVLGLVNGWWLALFLLTTGAMLVSYNKAALAIEIRIDDKGWPDLMERARRTWLFCGALIMNNAVPVPAALGGSLIHFALFVLAVLTHFTALQRFIRARRLLQVYEATLTATVAPPPDFAQA